MALTPYVNDKNRDKVLKEIDKLVKEDTAQSADELKEKHNMDADGKSSIRPATPAQTAQVTANKNK